MESACLHEPLPLPEHTVRRETPDGGQAAVTLYPVFPGIDIRYHDVHAASCPLEPAAPGVLEISHCREGRMEYRLGSRYFYLAPGDLSVARQDVLPTLAAFPTGHYHGITVTVDPGLAPRCLSCFLEAQRGQAGRTVRVMVLGIPNVGKSTFINKVARRKTARAEDRPGVTRSKQWVPVDSTLELLDTPGILWPRFDDPEVGKRLAFTGAIKDDVVDMEELACYLMDYLGRRYAPVLEERYKIDVQPEDSGYDLLEKAGRKRGFLMRGAQVDTQRMARVLLDEFRGGKLGRFTLETVEDAQ